MAGNREIRLNAEQPVQSYFRLSLPVVLGSIVTIVYNLADTYFIAQTGNALLIAGVSVCAPLFMILMALGNVFGQGGSSLISRLLGKKDLDGAGRVSAFCFYIALIAGAVLGLGMLILRDPLLRLLGCSQDTLPYAREYGTVLLLGAPLIVVNFIHMNLLRCEGMSGLSMLGTAFGSVVNVILDPLMIPSMGAAGAALATVIGYALSDALLLFFVLRKSACLSVRFRVSLPGSAVRDILGVGLSAAVTNLASSLCAVLVNQRLMAYGDDRIAAMGIVLKLTMIVQMILVGFSFGGIPLFGFLMGAGEKAKLRKLVRFCLVFLAGLALLMSAFVFLAARALLGVMTPDAALTELGVPMLRWQVAGSVFAGLVMFLTCLFQAGGKAGPAMALSLSRQGIVFALVLIILVRIRGYEGVIMSQCIADIVSAALALLLFRLFPVMRD